MIRYVPHDQIDKKRWDNCIEKSINGNIYAFSWYLDIVCENWDALITTDYTSVMPVTKGKKYLMDYIYPPFFTQQLGVFSTDTVSEDLCNKFLKAIPPVYRFIELNLNVQNKWVPPSFSVHRNSDFILSMDKPYEEIKRGYSEHHKRNISKAYRHNLSIFKHEETRVVIEMFRQNRGRFISNLKTNQYEMLAKLVETAAGQNMARVWSVSDETHTPCAGAIFFESHQSAFLIFSATTSRGRELSAMYFLLDQYLREFSRQLKKFDFEGSNNPELARFYKGFGSSEFVYLQIKKNQLPPPWNWFKN